MTKDELLEANWPGVTVTEELLTQCISEIRRALGDPGRNLLRTRPRRGYMIVLPDRPPSKGDTPVLANLPEVAWYRHPRFIITALLGAALFIL